MDISITQRIIPDMGFLVQRCREVKSVNKKIGVIFLISFTSNEYSETIDFIEKCSDECDMLIAVSDVINGENFHKSIASHRNVDYVYLDHGSTTDKLRKEFGADKVFVL